MESKIQECYGFFKYIIFIIIYGTLFILLFIQTLQVFSISLLMVFQLFFTLYLISDLYYSANKEIVGASFLLISSVLSLLGILFLIAGIVVFNQRRKTFNVDTGNPSLQADFNMFKYIYVSHFGIQLICSIMYFTQSPDKPFIHFGKSTEFHTLLKVATNIAMIILGLFTIYYGANFLEKAKTA